MASNNSPLLELEDCDQFQRRHIGPDESEIASMLKSVGARDLNQLVEQTVPHAIRAREPLTLPPPVTETQALAQLADMARSNQPMVSMLGQGYYGTFLPGVIQRNVLENPGWYTAYTPYQAEVSQGRMEALLNYQQMVMDLTGMELANASLLDEATAAAEAMTMAMRVNRKNKSTTFAVASNCHPQTIAVLQTRADPLGINVVIGEPAQLIEEHKPFGVLLQYPGTNGEVIDIEPLIEAAHAVNAIACVATDLLALTMLRPPGEFGADVVVGSAQRFGVPMGYGGPHAAFFATQDAHKRSMPGRVIGVSVDNAGRSALRMALQTREQHIRREKATSNICTAQVLLAVIAGLYAVYHGAEGLTRIAERVHRFAVLLANGFEQLGFEVETKQFFDTFQVRFGADAQGIVERARASGINLRCIDGERLAFSLDETTTREHLQCVWAAAGASSPLPIDDMDDAISGRLPQDLVRNTAFLAHPVFHRYRSETEMLRYLRKLQSKDVALDRSMIPLGSCTMKLNATTEMAPITWPGFASLHPFVPRDQAKGYSRLFGELEQWLCAITGFDAVSLQPNAGSQGEFAGLLVIRRYHKSRGEGHRNVCLIPSSAHGTNPASAVMAGMQVVVVACDSDGNIDVTDLEQKAAAHSERLASLMITYPSTHGVFEEEVVNICEIVHAHGGQVYMDGANLNAMVGLCRPAEIGADVSHMNLHKTFCIPHGGGGPGMGPIGVRAHLAAFLPDHPLVSTVNERAQGLDTIGPVSAAPWGSASILPISWAYIAMMGSQGLLRATQVAILSANYVAGRLSPHYPVVYTGKNGRVAHECIIDLRAIKESCGVSVDDVAKRLVDFGIHAPTMSWPVHDTMMVEPTESESKEELDRFCDAMIAIRREIDDVDSGRISLEASPLRNAPHTHHLLLQEWHQAYGRQQAFFPEGMQQDKYWPPVGRVDNVYGDKNLVCACPPLEDYVDAAQ